MAMEQTKITKNCSCRIWDSWGVFPTLAGKVSEKSGNFILEV